MTTLMPMLSRRHLLRGSALLAASPLLSRLALADAAPLSVGTYKGAAPSFFKEAGVEIPYPVNYAELAGGNLILEAMAGGSIDVGSMSEIPPIFAIQSKAPVKLIAILRGDVNNQVFLLPQGSAVRSVAELKGKRVGYVRSTTSHFFLIKALKEQGLSMADIQPVGLSPQDGFSAFQSGQVDAWVIYGIWIQIALARTGARILKTAKGYLSGNYLIAATDRALADPAKFATIKDYIQREQQVWNWQEANPEAWAKKSAAITGIDAERFMEQFRAQSEPYSLAPVDEAAIASQQEVADLFFEAGALPTRLDVTPLWFKGFPV